MKLTAPNREFFARDALEVAPNLLGGQLTSRLGGQEVRLRITEVEAYHGLGTGDVHDTGSHARMGQTRRNTVMFGPPAHLYVYLIYGMYANANVVCSPPGRPSGVLLRAGEVVAGTEAAAARRPAAKTAREIARGPGKLAMALGIEYPTHNGLDLLGDDAPVALLVPQTPLRAGDAQVAQGPRVGVSGHAGTQAFPWRFWLAGEPSVSLYRKAK